MPAMRRPRGRETAVATGQPPVPRFIVCPVCHLRNEVTARFCRDCGLPLGFPRDPVRGTTTRRADLPSERGAGIAAVLSLVAIVVIAAIAGYLVFRSFETAAITASASSTTPSIPVVTADRTPGATGSLVSGSSDSPSMAPSMEPRESSTRDPGDEPTGAPDGDPTEEPTRTLSTRTGWTCDPASIQDPLGGRWRIAQARWARQDSFDRLTFDLTRLKGSVRRGAIVSMEFLRPGRAASRYDVATPDGDRALVITFDGPLDLRAAMSARPGLTALASVEAKADGDGVVHAVLGISGDGCARILANDWRDGSDRTTTAKLVIDIRR